jgi:hypothetical protein
VTVDQLPNDSGPDRLLPLRWAVIAGLSTAVGVMIGEAAGLPYGVVAGLSTAATLHTIMK